MIVAASRFGMTERQYAAIVAMVDLLYNLTLMEIILDAAVHRQRAEAALLDAATGAQPQAS